MQILCKLLNLKRVPRKIRTPAVMEEEQKTPTHIYPIPGKRSYVHVTEENRLLLLVLMNDHAIRLASAARHLGIKYTTARHVVKKFKAAPLDEQTELMARARAFVHANQWSE